MVYTSAIYRALQLQVNENYVINEFSVCRYYPGEFNRLMSFFLMSYDLEKFVQGVDRCVEAAKRSSIYTSWVKRPTEATGWTSFVKELQHSVGQNLNSPTGNFVKGRK